MNKSDGNHTWTTRKLNNDVYSQRLYPVLRFFFAAVVRPFRKLNYGTKETYSCVYNAALRSGKQCWGLTTFLWQWIKIANIWFTCVVHLSLNSNRFLSNVTAIAVVSAVVAFVVTIPTACVWVSAQIFYAASELIASICALNCARELHCILIWCHIHASL